MLYEALTNFNIFSLCENQYTFQNELPVNTVANFNFTYLNNFLEDTPVALNTVLENVKSVYHYSIPVTKLYYPEPFVAMPSFLHYDPWFFHILIYQYWLWFIFIFLVVFFFLMFLCTLRWTNLRLKPRRETRGVSRSKCGDLITATVPTTWAGSIIIHESTDAIDFYDGFGTSELVIGIRAFQWGWEYYYPKDMDLNYNLNLNHSFYFGNSLKYNDSLTCDTAKTKYWRFYQLKATDRVINPLNFLLLNSTNFKSLNYNNVAELGSSVLDESNAFQKIFYSTSNLNLSTAHSFFSNNAPLTFYTVNYEKNNIDGFYLKRPTTLLSVKNNFNSLLNLTDLKSFSTYLTGSPNFLFNKTQLNLASTLFLNKKSLTNQVLGQEFDKGSFKLDYRLKLNYLFVKGLQDQEFLKKEATIRDNLNSNVLHTLSPSTSKTDLDNVFSVKKADKFLKKLNIDLFWPSSSSPVKNANPFFNLTLFDRADTPFNLNTPNLLQNEDETVSSAYLVNFWNTIFANIDGNKRSELDTMYALENLFLQHPTFSLIADYDFRRWQNIELIEEALFDSTLVNNGFYDFYLYKDKFSNYSFLTKSYVFDLKDYIFNDKFFAKKRFFKYDIIEKPFKSNAILNKPYNLFQTTDSFFLDVSNLSKTNFEYIAKNNDFFLNLDDAFNNVKTLKFFFNYSNTISSFKTLAFKNTFFSLEVLNAFKPSLEKTTFTTFSNINLNTHFFEASFSDLYKFTMDFKINENYNILYTYKNVTNTYNAIQKIFRTKISEMRSNFKNYTLSLVENQVPFISAAKYSHRNLSGKNLAGFLKLQPTKYNYVLPKTPFLFIHNLNNTYFFDYPFLISIKSDAGRYIWSDWFSKWNLVETQASSLAKYGMYGMPHTSKPFDFNSMDATNFKDAEQYSSRVMQSRKNFSSSWLFTPFFFLKTNTWLKDNISNFNITTNFLLYLNFYYVRLFYTTQSLNMNYFSTFASASSGSNSPSRNYISNIDLYSSYNFFLTSLTDILVKREYLFRQLNQVNLNSSLTHRFYTASPDNVLYQALKSSFSYVLYDFYDVDTSRFLYNHYTSLNKINYIWGLNSYLYDNLVTQSPLKSQFRAMKKGIANMVKIHANGAIALPIELRLQVLASSKDVIHSWAIPSAGIKIDCVPGYSSHRVMIFLLSGIYWGQCMEICGRYHHWMPIVVYFMKRDLFVLWCTHFVFFKDSEENINLASNFYNNHVKTVSFDKTSWLVN